ncbi:MAG: hypothetical protein GX860_09335 [Alcaligenaceae bacterium]|nr:hypothetical protein [Alcaligenaceae bacterium]
MSSTTPIIYYASVDANIATVLVATLNEQIYSISLGDSEQAPLQELYDYAQAHFNEVQFI